MSGQSTGLAFSKGAAEKLIGFFIAVHESAFGTKRTSANLL
jgi:hypothetical protein